MSIHAGEIPIEDMVDQLTAYLTRFENIVRMYRQWSEQRPQRDDIESVVKQSLKGRFDAQNEERQDGVRHGWRG